MKKVFGALLAAALVLAMSCTSVVPVQSDSGATANTKRGEATGNFLFGRYGLNADVSIATAAANGGIRKIATVDTKTVSYLGLFVIRTTIVTGE